MVPSLRVEGKGATRVRLEAANPAATSYDFVRGNVADLSESWRGVDVGSVVCLEDDSPDADTRGFEDLDQPATGQVFFYLYRGSPGVNVGPGSYGQSCGGLEREPASGGCAD